MNEERYLRQKLRFEFGIYVKKVRIFGTLDYYGEVFYLPYEIAGCCAGSVVTSTVNSKYYRSMSAIYRDAESGVFGKKKEASL